VPRASLKRQDQYVLTPLAFTRLQDASAAGTSRIVVPYANLGDAVRKIMRTEGPGGFWSGFGAVLVVSPIANGLYFSAYESCKHALADSSLERSLGQDAVFIVAGVVAQSAAGLAYTPGDVVKERLQVQRIATRPAQGNVPATAVYHGSWHAARSIIRADGVSTLFRGYWTQNAAWWPWNIIYFTAYERMRDALATRLRIEGGGQSLDPWHSAVCATAAAAGATVVTNPVDVVKTRLQALPHSRTAAGAWSIASAMLKAEGLSAFTAGIGARVLSIAPGSCITFFCFETIKRALA
jgi:Mitochondrial carrier protein